MTGPRIGSLFSGYGGLDMGVMAAIGGSVAWHVEYDKAPSKILAHHWPDVPNYGDVTAVDWSQVEPVDIITGGSPCQDLSHAGKRAGMTEGTRSNLWVAMREAIAQLRPSLVVWENVRGAYSAPADSELEHCAGCMGADRLGSGPVLRALGRVLGDLSDLGYDARWHGLRAADVGAPHGRFRVFVVAYAEHTQLERVGALSGLRSRPDPRTALRLPLPTGSVDTLLPTPAVNDMGEGKTPEAWDEWTAKMQAAHGNGNGHGKSLAIEAQRLLPTPRALDGTNVCGVTPNRTDEDNARAGITLHDISRDDKWGIYADAIARWEALTRPAPAPTQPSRKGTPQLSPAFSEWLMGLPEGHVTGVPGLSRNDMLKALGNGVVPQQAAAALRFLLSVEVAA